MVPFLLLFPWSLLLLAVLKRRAAYQRERAALPYSPRMLPPAQREPSRSTAADYLSHLNEATLAARTLDLVKPQAQSGDVEGLMRAPAEVAQALAALESPLSVLFAQKDLNVLGASPPLSESGRMDHATEEGIRGLQARFGQASSGRLDASARVAIRYAVGCIHAQDRMAFSQ
jgi:Putative peptidoglycan binding domain